MPIEAVDAAAGRALQQIADKIATARKILAVTGAGISTNCGIPDFRSQEGLYSLIANEYETQASRTAASVKHIKGRDLFDVNVWKSPDTTAVFLRFMAGLRRSCRVTEPSATHRFIKLLRDQRRLVRTYTQNIDGLERRMGLRTDLADGRGSRSRFTKKSLALPSSASEALPGGALHGGCEAVQLHGDLESLRCSICQRLYEWDDGDRHNELASGAAPPCPSCAEQDEVRRIAGRRGTRVGILRPNVVLYGEEHQSADLIGPLVTSDIANCPDLLLIFGTSLKVHGLQKIVKEFAHAVHARKNGEGCVIFINNTPPAGSIWKDVIDSWVHMDCDAFVRRMRKMRPDIWAKQVSLPYTMGRGEKKSPKISKSVAPLVEDKENMGTDCLGKTMIQDVSTPKKQRRTLADISPPTSQGIRSDVVHVEHNPSSPVSTPRKKRKHSEFDVYEEGPIVVESPTGSRTLKAVMVPLEPSITTEKPISKRIRTL